MLYFLRNLTAAAVLAHALAGCCAHQAHAGDCGAVEPHHGSPEATHAPCGHGEAAHDCACEHGHDDPQQCQHGSCFWTAERCDPLVSPQHVLQLLAAAAPPELGELCPQAGQPTAVAHLPTAPPPPVRPHLAKCVLLI